jgi:hypothetical protein
MNEPVAFSGWIGHRNIGDEAIYLGLQTLFPDFQFSDIEHLSSYRVLMYGGGTILPDYVSRRADHLEADINVCVGIGVGDTAFWNQKFHPLDVGYYLGRIADGDLVDQRHIKWLFNRLNLRYDARQDYDKYLTEHDFKALKEANIDYIGVRGPISSSLLDQYDIQHREVGDTALILEPSSYVREQRDRIAVVLRDNTFAWASNSEYHETIIEFCQQNSDSYEFVFIPFWPPDIDVCLKAAKAVPNSSFVDYCSYIDVKTILEKLAGVDLVIADKLHASILGACAYTPFISLEYRTKNRDFAHSVGMDEFNIRTDAVTVDDLKRLTEKALSSEEITRRLETKVEEKRETLAAFAEEVTIDIHDQLDTAEFAE